MTVFFPNFPITVKKRKPLIKDYFLIAMTGTIHAET